MLIFKSTLIAAFILLLFSGFNTTSADTSEENLPDDYTEYEQELQYLEKIQESEEEAVADMVSDSVSTQASATEKTEIPLDELSAKPEVVTPTEPVSPRRIRSR